MQVQCQSNGELLTLTSSFELGAGGEARVYVLPQHGTLVAKIYHAPTTAHARKLATMLANPPDDPMAGRQHISIAWPVDLLQSVPGRTVVGFMMPRVTGASSIIDFYNPMTRRQNCPLFNYAYLYRTARNLAAAVRALHASGYVIGDVNESNILVTDTALVTLVDTDSFQVRDPHTGVMYRCPVGKPEFTPPELQGQPFAQIDRAPEHDLFALAVLLFQLLMEGIHPFAGVFQGRGDPPPVEARIVAGHFPYATRQPVRYQPPPVAPPWEVLPPTLRHLFVRCFEGGHHTPPARPDAQTWQLALHEAELALATCPVNTQHRYGNHLPVCPWCERARHLGGHDPFPSRQAVQRGVHLQPIAAVQTPLPLPTGGRQPTPAPAYSPTPPLQASSGVGKQMAIASTVLICLVAVLLLLTNMPFRETSKNSLDIAVSGTEATSTGQQQRETSKNSWDIAVSLMNNQYGPSTRDNEEWRNTKRHSQYGPLTRDNKEWRYTKRPDDAFWPPEMNTFVMYIQSVEVVSTSDGPRVFVLAVGESQTHDCHACTGLIRAFILKPQTDKDLLVASSKDIPFGQSGLPNSYMDEYFRFQQFGPRYFGWVLWDAEMHQGIRAGGYTILTQNKSHSVIEVAGTIPKEYSTSSAGFCDQEHLIKDPEACQGLEYDLTFLPSYETNSLYPIEVKEVKYLPDGLRKSNLYRINFDEEKWTYVWPYKMPWSG